MPAKDAHRIQIFIILKLFCVESSQLLLESGSPQTPTSALIRELYLTHTLKVGHTHAQSSVSQLGWAQLPLNILRPGNERVYFSWL